MTANIVGHPHALSTKLLEFANPTPLRIDMVTSGMNSYINSSDVKYVKWFFHNLAGSTTAASPVPVLIEPSALPRS